MRMGGITYPQLISTPYHPSRRLYVIDYHLKACIVVEKCKINITGSRLQKRGCGLWLHFNVILRVA